MDKNSEYIAETIIDKYYVLHTIWAFINIALLVILIYFIVKLYSKVLKY
ncbi:hypothetical protein B0I10_101216 [Flavobacterium lacus]|uniref:Uncharacterized protein n=1 Tax=Flavobacterium lacus TaxID=1353778 RepID=A0A328WXU6_9FLAO|nr:hypothetical protein B0I10_101216 [Flavobacterium lacus]